MSSKKAAKDKDIQTKYYVLLGRHRQAREEIIDLQARVAELELKLEIKSELSWLYGERGPTEKDIDKVYKQVTMEIDNPAGGLEATPPCTQVPVDVDLLEEEVKVKVEKQ